MDHRVALYVAVILATGMLLAGCSEDPADRAANPQECPTPEAVTGSKLDELPPRLPLQKWGTIVKVTKRAGFVGAELISDATIAELYGEISRAVRDGGYLIVSSENEGFEAELFFQKGPNTGTFLLRQGPCKGDVTVKLIYGATKGGGN